MPQADASFKSLAERERLERILLQNARARAPELQHVLAEGRRLGARRATLEVRASNVGARRLYERLGFYMAGTRRNYYTSPVEDALILWRDDGANPRART